MLSKKPKVILLAVVVFPPEEAVVVPSVVAEAEAVSVNKS